MYKMLKHLKLSTLQVINMWAWKEEITFMTKNFRLSNVDRLDFLFPFITFFLTKSESKVQNPPSEPDSFHLIPTILRVPSALGVTVS